MKTTMYRTPVRPRPGKWQSWDPNLGLHQPNLDSEKARAFGKGPFGGSKAGLRSEGAGQVSWQWCGCPQETSFSPAGATTA